MKVLEIELPDRLAHDLATLVSEGWFATEDEAVRAALLQFLRDRRFELAELYQYQDIDWAIEQKQGR